MKKGNGEKIRLTRNRLILLLRRVNPRPEPRFTTQQIHNQGFPGIHRQQGNRGNQVNRGFGASDLEPCNLAACFHSHSDNAHALLLPVWLVWESSTAQGALMKANSASFPRVMLTTRSRYDFCHMSSGSPDSWAPGSRESDYIKFGPAPC